MHRAFEAWPHIQSAVKDSQLVNWARISWWQPRALQQHAGLRKVVTSSKVSLPNKSRIEGGLLVQQWQHRWEVIQDEAGLVVSCCAE